MLKITERGYAGHFCASSQCRYTRNTLVEFPDGHKIVLSAIGNYCPNVLIERINSDSYYEIMIFDAEYESPYWESNIGCQIYEFRLIQETPVRGSDLVVDSFHDLIIQTLADNITSISNCDNIYDQLKSIFSEIEQPNA
jgi:hypothetical protein